MNELPNRLHVDKPWGFFDQFTLNERSTVKILHTKAEETLSLQTHVHRSEFWYIISGTGTVTINNTAHAATPGNEFYVPQGSTHRIEGGPDGITFLEIAFGEFDEEDITRLEDKYGRS